MRNNCHIRSKDLAAFFTAAVLGIALLIVFLSPNHTQSLSDRFLPEHIRVWELYDSNPQILAHKVALGLIVLFGFAGLWYSVSKPNLSESTKRLWGRCARFMHRYGGLLIAPLCVISFFKATDGGVARGLILILLYVSATVAISMMAKYTSTGFLRSKIWIILLIYLSFFLVPGLVKTPNLAGQLFLVPGAVKTSNLLEQLFLIPGSVKTPNLAGQDLTYVELHHFGTCAQADRLATGQRFFQDFVPNYGYIWTSVVGYVEQTFGPWAFGGYIRFIQILQVIFCLLVVFAYHKWKPRDPFYILFAVLMVVPWQGTLGNAVFIPNQSSWRFMGFPLGIIALLLIRQTALLSSALTLGLCGGSLLLYNPETGIAITAGYIIFLCLRIDIFTARKLFLVVGAFLSGMASSFMLWCFIFRWCFGYWPFPANMSDLVWLISRFAGGVAGKPLYLDGLAVVIFCHATYVVIWASMAWRMKALSFTLSFKVAIGVIILIWFAYWANRPHCWNIWSYVFLYGFLLSTYIDRRVLAKRWSRSSSRILDIRTLVLCLILLRAIIGNNAHEAYLCLERFLYRIPNYASLVSGVWLPQNVAVDIERKAAFLRIQPDPNELLYFSGHCFLMPKLSGIYPRLPVVDMFGASLIIQDYRDLVKRIFIIDPKRILFEARNDSPSSRWDIERQTFYERLKRDLQPIYRPTALYCGWEIWEKTNEDPRLGNDEFDARG